MEPRPETTEQSGDLCTATAKGLDTCRLDSLSWLHVREEVAPDYHIPGSI